MTESSTRDGRQVLYADWFVPLVLVVLACVYVGYSVGGVIFSVILAGVVVYLLRFTPGVLGAVSMPRGKRVLVRIRRWIDRPHSVPYRRWVLGVLLTIFVLTTVFWYSFPNSRLLFATLGGFALWSSLGYAGLKCCLGDSIWRKVLIGATAFFSGIQGNYLASVTMSGQDATAMDDWLKPAYERLGLIEADVKEIKEITQRTEEKINQVVDYLIAQLETRDMQIEELRNQLHNAIAAQVVAEQSDGRSPDMVLDELRGGDASSLLEFLDRYADADERRLIERHRERAAVAYVVGDLDRAGDSYDKILALLPEDLSAIAGLGDIALTWGSLDIAESIYLQVLDGAQDDVARIIAFDGLGQVEQEYGNWKIADGYYKQALAISEGLGSSAREMVATQFFRIGTIQYMYGNLESAEMYYKQALVIDKELGNRSGVGSALLGLGNVELDRGSLESAEVYFSQFVAIVEELGSKDGLSNGYQSLGVVEEVRGNLESAEAYYKKALVLNKEVGDKKGIAISFGNLGAIEWVRGDFVKAKAHHRKSMVINKELNNKEGLANNYTNLGLIESDDKNWDMAERYFKQSATIYEELGHKRGVANNLRNLGVLARRRGDVKSAEAYYKQSLEIEKEIGYKKGIAANLGNLGVVESDRGNFEMAKQYYEQSLAINREIENKEGVAVLCHSLGVVEWKRGNLMGAHELWTQSRDLYAEIGVSYRVEEIQVSIDMLEVSYDLNVQLKMARLFREIGKIDLVRGNLEAAHRSYHDSLIIYQESEITIEELQVQIDLGMIDRLLKKDDKAVVHFLEAFELAERLGNQVEMGTSLWAIATIERGRKNFDDAEQYQLRLLPILEELGDYEKIAFVERDLGSAAYVRGENDDARQRWTRSRDLFKKIGNQQRARQLESFLSKLN